jgi:hypothetical protein
MPRHKNKVTRVNFYLPDVVLKFLKQQARRERTTYSALLRRGVVTLLREIQASRRPARRPARPPAKKRA